MSSQATSLKEPQTRRPAFKARTSRLDSETINSEHFSMRGFFTAFWIALALYSLHTVHKTWKVEGVPLRLQLFYYMSQDGITLFCADMLLIASCFFCVILHKLIVYKVIPQPLWILTQHLWQSIWFGGFITYVFVKDWPWIQSGFFTLHSVSMLMKQHSYLATNIEMEGKYRLLERKKKWIESKKIEDKQELDIIQANIEKLTLDTKTLSTAYPQNVTFRNFLDYMLVPTLVYDLEYPRTSKFRLGYFMEKVAGILAAFFLLYLTIDHYILPVVQAEPSLNFIDLLMGLLMPFMVCYFMIFYIIFEGICNAFAEITLFADRDFYSDWWNSTSFDEFSRKWNRPVHEFLLRHVYLESLESHKFSKQNATLLTFLLSSCLHELVMFVVGKKFRLYLFSFQMFQIPLIYFARIPFIRRKRLLGNIIFWIGMLMASFNYKFLFTRDLR